MARAAKPGIAYLDTHIVCWLYEGRIELLSSAAAELLERSRLLVSPLVDLELQFLYEVGRISKGPAVILKALAEDVGLDLGTTPFARVAAEARDLSWTRDPFDRLIAAEAMVARAKLVTKDRVIREHCPVAVW